MERSAFFKLSVVGAAILLATATVVRRGIISDASGSREISKPAALPLGSTDSATIAAIAAEGRAFPRDSVVPPYPPYEFHERITLVGSPTRECVDVPPEREMIVRSGEFAIGGHLPSLVHGRSVKLWWQPLNSTMDMKLLVRGRRLGTPTDTLRFEATEVVAPLHSETLEPYGEEAAFPTGTLFPSAGTWVVVATSRRNWGCFIFPVR